MKKLLSLFTALILMGGMMVVQAADYYVAHNGNLGGQSWSNNREIMTSNGNSEYYRTYFAVPSGTITFKVTKNASWSDALAASAIDNSKSDITLSDDNTNDHNITFSNSSLQNITIWTNGTKVWVKVNDPYIKQLVLNNTQVMFYYGCPSNWNPNSPIYFNSSNTAPSNGTYPISGKTQSSWKSSYNTAIGQYNLNSSTTYYLSNNNTWAGNGKSGLTAGCFADMSSSVTQNNNFVCTLGSTSYAITEGDASVAITSTVSGKSGLGLNYSLDHYYISADGSTWSEFDPTNTSSLAVGTYTVRALATDGHIYLRSTNYATLTVSAYVPGAHDITATAATKWTYGNLPASETTGETVQFTVTPDAGYSVTVSSSDVTITKNGNTYSFTMPDNDVAISVVANALSYNISYPASPSHYTLAGGNPTSGNTDAAINFTVTPDAHYVLTVTANGIELTGVSNVYSFTMPAQDVTIAVTAQSYRSFYGSTPLYLNAAAIDWWCNDNAVQHATFVKEDNSEVVVTGVVEENKIYAFTPEAGYYKFVQFSRHNPSNVSEDWGHTDHISLIGTEAHDYVTAFAQNASTATWSTFVPTPSYTFPAGTIIYYDLREYNGGVDDKDGVWHGTTNEIFGITLASDWKVTASTKLFRSGPNNNWGDRTCATLPTTGQNIIVSADGITCHWDTYVPTYTVVGEVPGLDWDETKTTNDMTENNGIYTLVMENVELAVNTYAYKIVKDHSYSKAYPQEGNASMSITTAGIYNLTFTLDLSASPEYSVTPTLIQEIVVIPAVKMYGTFADGSTWGDTQEFTIAGNNESASLTLENLPVGNYTFKVVVGSSYRGNGHIFYRDYTEAANIGDGGNMTLEADVAGNYTFTWTYENDSLGIEFPAEPTPEYVDINFFAPRDETNKWEYVYAYSYKGSRKFLGVWPGTEITSTKDAGWYTVSVRKGSNLIFTDNAGMETNAIEDIQAAACYESTSIYYPEDPNEAKKVTVTANANCEVAYYIAGSQALIGGEAEADFDTNLPLDENNQIVFHEVQPGTYAFKINNGTWAWSIGGIDHMKEGDCASIAQEVGTGDLGFAIETKQDVTVTYYPETQEICLGAVTVKADGTITANDMSIEAGESKSITYWTNNTEAAGATFTIVSGGDYILLNNGVITGIKHGETVIRIAVAETANYTEATKDITVTVTTPVVPAVDPIAPIGGKFIINSKGDTAVFSRGNLQYQQSSGTWRCAPNQYEWKGNGNLQMGNAEYEGWVDLFSWSIGAENNYGATSAYLTTDYYNKAFVDWGGLFAGDWSTLSIDQWFYMLYNRANADDLWGMAMIGDTLGMVLLPNGWNAPSGVTFVPGTTPTTDMWYDADCLDPTLEDQDHWRVNAENMPANKFTEEQWAILEAAGAVFCPYGGRRSGGYGNHTNRDNVEVSYEYNYTYYENYQGAYWTSTVRNAAEGKVYWLPMMCNGCIDDNENWGRGSHGWWENGRYGHSVRLVNIIPRQYTVTYNVNGAEGNVPVDVQTYLDGAAITLADASGLTKENCIFAGWKFKGQIYNPGETYTIANVLANEEIVFEAQWTEYYKRENLTPGMFGTICLPKAGQMTGGAIFEVAYRTTSMIYFDEVLNGEMVAGMPYVYLPSANTITVTYTAAAGVAEAGHYKGLYGTFAHMDGGQLHGKYIFYNNNIFPSTNTANWLDENRAYIVLDEVPTQATAAAPGRRRVSMGYSGTNTATGIGEVPSDKVQSTKVLIDGQLYLLRGEKLYDATGRLVK